MTPNIMLLLASSSATIDEKHPPKDNASNKKIDTQTCHHSRDPTNKNKLPYEE
jgi:hypothetical protein